MTDTTNTTTADPRDRVGELLDEVLAGTTVFPVEVVVRGRTGSRVVDVFVDGDGPLGAEDLASISRELGAAIDAEDFIRGAWRLNVSTPGADRPLQSIRQVRKHAGRTLEVRWRGQDPDDERSVTGELVAVEEDRIVLRSGDGAEHRVPFPDVVEAKVQLPW